MNLPEHLSHWQRFVKGLSPALMSQLQDGETLTVGAQRLMLQALFEAGCLRRPETAHRARAQKETDRTRGQDG